MAEPAWGFTDPADARRYLGELGRIWAVWEVGLVLLFTTDGVLLVLSGVVVIAALFWLARPLQRRAVAQVPVDTFEGKRWSLAVGRGTPRDQALRAFAYGPGPLGAAVALAGAGPWWRVFRLVILGSTVAAFVVLIVDLLRPAGG